MAPWTLTSGTLGSEQLNEYTSTMTDISQSNKKTNTHKRNRNARSGNVPTIFTALERRRRFHMMIFMQCVSFKWVHACDCALLSTAPGVSVCVYTLCLHVLHSLLYSMWYDITACVLHRICLIMYTHAENEAMCYNSLLILEYFSRKVVGEKNMCIWSFWVVFFLVCFMIDGIESWGRQENLGNGLSGRPLSGHVWDIQFLLNYKQFEFHTLF